MSSYYRVHLLYLIITFVSVQAPVTSINTRTQKISRHPLAIILSSLCINLRDFHYPSKVYFEPLIVFVVSRAPGPNVPTALDSPQSSKIRRVIFVSRRRSRDLSVLDSATAHAQGTVTEGSCGKIQTVKKSVIKSFRYEFKLDGYL